MTKTKSIKTGAVALAAAFLVAPTALGTQSVPAVTHAELSVVKKLANSVSTPVKAYTINTKYALGTNEGSSLLAANKFIVLHDVGVESGAAANANYFKNNWASSQSYTQLVVGDGGQVYLVGALGYQAWGAYSYANANSPVQIELGHASTYAQFKLDYAAYVAVAHDMALKFGIPLRFNNATSGIITHHFVSLNFEGDHVDPDGYLAKWGVSQAMLGHDVVTGVSSLNGGTTTTAPSTTVTTTSTGLTAENGSFTNGDQPIQARYSPSLSGAKAGQLPAGCTVHYDGYINADGYCWVHYTSYSGDSIYLPVHPTGSANNVWGTFK